MVFDKQIEFEIVETEKDFFELEKSYGAPRWLTLDEILETKGERGIELSFLTEAEAQAEMMRLVKIFN